MNLLVKYNGCIYELFLKEPTEKYENINHMRKKGRILTVDVTVK